MKRACLPKNTNKHENSIMQVPPNCRGKLSDKLKTNYFRMKRNAFFRVLTFIFILTGIFSCSKEIPDPVACFEVSSETIKLGESVTFTSCSQADHTSIWTGDTGRDYTKREITGETRYVARDVGVRVANSVYTYTYRNPGQYTIHWIATNVGNDGRDVKTAVAQRVVTVVE
jgi:plastocyanin